MSVGEFVSKLLEENSYYGAFLPRLPVIIEREVRKELLRYGKKRTRKAENLKKIGRNQGFLERGVHCFAISQ